MDRYGRLIVNLLAGSLAGAWFGAGWATRLKSETLYKVIAALLVLIAGFERQRDSATIFERVAGPLMPVGAWSVCWLLFRADPFGAFAHLALLRL